ncbi:MAG: hypothetical protein JSV86_16875 [Gemmatimonadota bacterium]|nr:MAG: hypothetical protein JSV86_16875 [Gemmatimonadota bacterium]
MPKPPFNARYPGVCEVCTRPVNVGDEVQWGRARGAVVHVPCVNPPQTSTSTVQPGPRNSDEGPSTVEEAAFSIFEALCRSSGTADWDERMLATRAFKLAEAFFAERARRRKSAQGELPIGYE